MFRHIWNFVSDPKNIAALTLLGGALAFAWKVAEPRWFSASQAAQTRAGSAQVAPTGTASYVAAPTGRLGASATQHAEARSGGTAVVAGDHAAITITR